MLANTVAQSCSSSTTVASMPAACAQGVTGVRGESAQNVIASDTASDAFLRRRERANQRWRVAEILWGPLLQQPNQSRATWLYLHVRRGASVTRWAAINAIQWRAVAVLVFCVLVSTGCKKWTQRGAKRVGWLPKSLRQRRSRAIKSSDRHASVAPTREHRSTLAAHQPSPAAPPPVNHQRGAAECSV